MGVTLGAENADQAKFTRKVPIETVVEGTQVNTPQGDIFQVEDFLSHSATPTAAASLSLDAPLDLIAEWAGEKRIAGHKPEQFAFIDTETTGLSGGTGTIAFMVGAGRFETDGFRLIQLFMREPGEEPALLHALEEFLAPAKRSSASTARPSICPCCTPATSPTDAAIPSKRPPTSTCCTWPAGCGGTACPAAPSATWKNISFQTRTEEDTPGWMIPQMYFDYLRSRDARPMKGIFYHNAMDILTLAALTEHIAHLLADPLDGRWHMPSTWPPSAS